jgi:DNA-directed RNA polymerase subunit RPC12/RpoP
MEYIVYRCETCGKHFLLFTKEVTHSEKESKYITCPFHGKHKDIRVCYRDDSIEDCIYEMNRKDTYKKRKGRIVQSRWE